MERIIWMTTAWLMAACWLGTAGALVRADGGRLSGAVGLGTSRVMANVVDHFEVNHKMCERTGKESFVQVIAWRWNADYQRMDVASYSVVHDELTDAWPNQTAGGWWEWNRDGVAYRARSCRETWTMVDPEQRNQRVLSALARGWVWPAVRCER